MSARKKRGEQVDGMLLLDKPAGVTSNRALQDAKRLLNANKAGHTGSLDPIATGLLPLCFGETTRIAGLFLDADKCYNVTIRLGVATDTGDAEGKVVAEREVKVSDAQLNAALEKFRGSFKQTPPMFSALKKHGTPLYKLARQGVTVEREARAVTVYQLTIAAFTGDTVELAVKCSRGFYLRALAADLGEMLGCGASVSALRRTAVGAFNIADAVTLAQLEAADGSASVAADTAADAAADAAAGTADAYAARREFLLPTERALAHLPELRLPDNLAAYLCRGKAVKAPAAVGGGKDADGGVGAGGGKVSGGAGADDGGVGGVGVGGADGKVSGDDGKVGDESAGDGAGDGKVGGGGGVGDGGGGKVGGGGVGGAHGKVSDRSAGKGDGDSGGDGDDGDDNKPQLIRLYAPTAGFLGLAEVADGKVKLRRRFHSADRRA